MTTAPASRLDRAVRLFEFLARVQQSVATAPRALDGYEVAWTRDMPRHAAVHFAHWDVAPEPEDEIGSQPTLRVERPRKPGSAAAASTA